MLKKYEQLMLPSLSSLLRNLTTYCLMEIANENEDTVAELCLSAGKTRKPLLFIQQEDVEFMWIDELNTQGLVCSFKLRHETIRQMAMPYLNPQRLKWELIFPAFTLDDIKGVSNNYLLDTAIFRIVSRGFSDSIVDEIEMAIIDMSS